MGLMKLMFFNLFLNELHRLYTEEKIFLIEDSSINFSLFRTSDFHSTIRKLCHSRNVYDFKINITPTKYA